MMDSKDAQDNHQIVPSARGELARRSDALAARGLHDLSRCPPRDKPPTLTLDCASGVQMELVRIPAGTFTMGSDEYCNDEVPHQVTISKAFHMGKYQVTQEQWHAAMGNNPSHFKGAKKPVDSVSWDDCQEFLEKLNNKIPHFRPVLPTEAQWEYACRAGDTRPFCFRNNESALSEYAWFRNNAAGRTHAVGEKKPNAWGLYDMLGNVFEWCEDWYGAYSWMTEMNPKGAPSGEQRVLRGAACGGNSSVCRAGYRYCASPSSRRSNCGFRLVLEQN
jgi:formylglycine-generating enzyme required for sulfatase activity